MNIKNAVVVITGSSSGIGRATALKFARLGARLIINSKSNVEGGRKVVSQINELGGTAIYVRADVSDPLQVKSLFEQTRKEFGSIDVLINNAGSNSGAGSLLETTKDDWIAAINDNLITAVLCSQEAAKTMIEQGHGKIINTASIRGMNHTGRPGLIAYSAAKAALINFTSTLSKELAPSITVNAVVPGFVNSPVYDKMPLTQKQEFIDGTLIHRFIKPEEVADAYLYLASSDVITGQILVIDGGFTLK